MVIILLNLCVIWICFVSKVFSIKNHRYRFRKIKEEIEFLKKSDKVQVIKIKDIKKKHSKRYYVTIDIDVLDPVYAPGVDHPVPKGMKPAQLITAIKQL